MGQSSDEPFKQPPPLSKGKPPLPFKQPPPLPWPEAKPPPPVWRAPPVLPPPNRILVREKAPPLVWKAPPVLPPPAVASPAAASDSDTSSLTAAAASEEDSDSDLHSVSDADAAAADEAPSVKAAPFKKPPPPPPPFSQLSRWAQLYTTRCQCSCGLLRRDACERRIRLPRRFCRECMDIVYIHTGAVCCCPCRECK